VGYASVRRRIKHAVALQLHLLARRLTPEAWRDEDTKKLLAGRGNVCIRNKRQDNLQDKLAFVQGSGCRPCGNRPLGAEVAKSQAHLSASHHVAHLETVRSTQIEARILVSGKETPQLITLAHEPDGGSPHMMTTGTFGSNPNKGIHLIGNPSATERARAIDFLVAEKGREIVMPVK
jgi:hypothetical protein